MERVSKHIFVKLIVNNLYSVDQKDVNRRIGVLPREISESGFKILRSQPKS